MTSVFFKHEIAFKIRLQPEMTMQKLLTDASINITLTSGGFSWARASVTFILIILRDVHDE